MKLLRNQIALQKKEKLALEKKIDIFYGGEEKGMEKEEQMNLIMHQNKHL